MLSSETLYKLYWEQEKSLQEIGEIAEKNPQTILNWMKKRGIKRRSRSEASKLSYEKNKGGIQEKFHNSYVEPNLEPSEELAYILGVIEGDGWVSVSGEKRQKAYRVGLSVKDKEFAKHFHEKLEEIGLNPGLWKMGNGAFRVNATSKLFYEWYKELGLRGIEELVSQSESFIREFIKGMYDSDGTLYQKKYKECVKIASMSRDKILMIKRLLEEIGFNFNLNSHKTNFGKVFILKKSGRRNVWEFSSTVGSSLSRKLFNRPKTPQTKFKRDQIIGALKKRDAENRRLDWGEAKKIGKELGTTSGYVRHVKNQACPSI